MVFTYRDVPQPTVATVLFAAAILIGGTGMFITGMKNLVRFDFDMKTLMTIAIIGAAVIGEWQEAAVVVFLFAVSEALEAYSMNKARQSIRQLMDIAPASALVKRNGEHDGVANGRHTSRRHPSREAGAENCDGRHRPKRDNRLSIRRRLRGNRSLS